MAERPPPPPADDPRLTAAGFAREQAVLGRCWNFLGFEHRIPRDQDWFTTRLGGRSIFVQRFGDTITAFDNKCAHRGFPLREGPAGNGPVLCGFHHWRYNDCGSAVGIPHCQEMFGRTPRELDARLTPVEIARCGPMLFGRFAGGDPISLEDWLGPGYDILRHLSTVATAGDITASAPENTYDVHANWRTLVEITLDDLHVPAVHAKTIGKAGYVKPDRLRYWRFGAHSCMCASDACSRRTLDDIRAACAAGTYAPDCYRIFQFFPSLVVVVGWASRVLGDGYWTFSVQHLVPETPDRTGFRLTLLPLAPKPGDFGWRGMTRRLVWPGMLSVVRHVNAKVNLEDMDACERLQRALTAGEPTPRLARFEERIGWFDDVYRRILAGEHMSARQP